MGFTNLLPKKNINRLEPHSWSAEVLIRISPGNQSLTGKSISCHGNKEAMYIGCKLGILSLSNRWVSMAIGRPFLSEEIDLMGRWWGFLGDSLRLIIPGLMLALFLLVIRQRYCPYSKPNW